MRTRIAKASLVVALVLFVTGLFLLCACPGWYALASGFAGVTVWLGGGRMRAWGALLLVASLLLNGGHTYAKLREAEQRRDMKRKVEQLRAP